MSAVLPAMPEFRTPEAELLRHQHDYLAPLETFGDLDAFFQARLPKSPLALSFLQKRFCSVTAWRTEALQCLESALRRPQRSAIASQRCCAVFRRSQWIQEEWILETTERLRIPATVLKPDTGRASYPVVIALHDMGGMRLYGREKLFPVPGEPGYLTKFRHTNYGETALAETFVRAGYLVVAIDALGFGERMATWGAVGSIVRRRAEISPTEIPDANALIVQAESAAARCAMLLGTTWAGMLVQDDVLSVDFACSRDDVDVDRIGCTGLSFGAFRANYLAAVDERIRATVSVCWHSHLKGIVGYNVGGAIGWFAQLPGLSGSLDLGDIASLACPRAFFAMSGWRDILMQPLGAVAAHETLVRTWDKAGHPANLGSRFFDSPHEYNASMQEAALAWFAEKLGQADS